MPSHYNTGKALQYSKSLLICDEAVSLTPSASPEELDVRSPLHSASQRFLGLCFPNSVNSANVHGSVVQFVTFNLYGGLCTSYQYHN